MPHRDGQIARYLPDKKEGFSIWNKPANIMDVLIQKTITTGQGRFYYDPNFEPFDIFRPLRFKKCDVFDRCAGSNLKP